MCFFGGSQCQKPRRIMIPLHSGPLSLSSLIIFKNINDGVHRNDPPSGE